MKKRNGFTLIELMAVIIILAVIALIVTPLIIGGIKESKERLYDTQLENIKSAAKSFMIDLDLENDLTLTLTLDELKKAGYVKEDIKNPKTGESFNKCLLVSVERKDNAYEYEVIDTEDEDCEISKNIVMILLGSVNETVTLNKRYVEPGVIVKTIDGRELDQSKIKVEIKQYKNNALIKTIKDDYSKINDLIETNDYYEYDIKYIYEDTEGSASKTRNLKVQDANNLQCIILPTGKKNDSGWITDNRQVSILSINSNKKVKYSISINGSKNYNDNQTIDVGKDGKVTVYGYIKDEEGNESACTATFKYEVSNPSCNIKLEGTQKSNNWYISDVQASLELNAISPVVNQGISLTNEKVYNNNSSLTLSNSGNIYGFMKDQAGKEVSCSNSANIDKTQTISTKITGTLENTTTAFTSGSIVNSNVLLSSTVTPATTTSGYSYQWYKDNSKISGANSATYLVTETGTYKLIVTSGSGIIGTSNEMKVTIDKILPTVKYSYAGGVYSQNLNLTVTSTDTNLNYMTIHIYKDGAFYSGETINASGTTANKTITLTGNSEWYVYTMAFDKAGNKQNQVPDNGSGWYYQVYYVDTTVAAASITAKDLTGAVIGSGTEAHSRLNITLTGTSGYDIYYCIDTNINTNNPCTPDIKYTGTFNHGIEGFSYIRYKASKNVGGTLKESSIGSYQANLKLVTASCSISISGTKGSNNWYTGNLNATMTKTGNGSYGMRINNGSWQRNITTLNSFTASSATQTITGFVYPYADNTTGGVNCSSSFKYDNTPPTNVGLTVKTNDGYGKVSKILDCKCQLSTGCSGTSGLSCTYYYADTVLISSSTITATATDSESGIWKYEFYVDAYDGSSSLKGNGKGASNPVLKDTVVTSNNTASITTDEYNNKDVKYIVKVYNNAGLSTTYELSDDCSATSTKCWRLGTSNSNEILYTIDSNYTTNNSGYVNTCKSGKYYCDGTLPSGGSGNNPSGCTSNCGPSTVDVPASCSTSECSSKCNGSTPKVTCVVTGGDCSGGLGTGGCSFSCSTSSTPSC